MQAYVQGGTEAIGRLAQRIEEHAKLFVLQDHNITQHVIDAVGVSSDDVMGQLELIKEKVGLHGRDQEQLQAAIERMIDARDAGPRRAGALGLAGRCRSSSRSGTPRRRSWSAPTASSRSTRPRSRGRSTSG